MTLQRRATDHLVVVGFDPSLRNWGIAKGILVPLGLELQIYELDVCKPEVSEGKQVRNNSKDLQSAQQLAQAAMIAAKGADAIFVEVPHSSQNARGAAAYGVCLGVLGALRATGIPFFEVSEGEVKKASTGNKQSTKAETIAWAMEKHPEAPWPMQTQLGVQSVIASKAEHMADAVGAIYAGIASSAFQQVLPFIKPKLN